MTLVAPIKTTTVTNAPQVNIRLLFICNLLSSFLWRLLEYTQSPGLALVECHQAKMWVRFVETATYLLSPE